MWKLYLDESGDLGFDFEEKKPTNYLTIGILAVSQSDVVKAISCAIRKTLKRKVNKGKKNDTELKGASSTFEVKQHFYNQISSLKFGVYAMTLNKKRVKEHLHKSAETKSRLYNYIAKQVLDQIPFEKANGAVELIVDKSKGKKEIRDFDQYVLNQLKSRIDPLINVSIYHRDSCHEPLLSAIDLFTWGIFRRYERNDPQWMNQYFDKIICNEVYLDDK